MSISGLVVEYIVAIDVTRVRFPADALLLALYCSGGKRNEPGGRGYRCGPFQWHSAGKEAGDGAARELHPPWARAGMRITYARATTMGPFRELNPGPLAPEARIIPLDQTAI